MYRIQGIPNIVLIGVSSVKQLYRVKAKLHAAGVGYYCWEEPDLNLGFTAIATQPLDRQEKEFLAYYRVWQPIFPGSSEKERFAAQVAKRSEV